MNPNRGSCSVQNWSKGFNEELNALLQFLSPQPLPASPGSERSMMAQDVAIEAQVVVVQLQLYTGHRGDALEMISNHA